MARSHSSIFSYALALWFTCHWTAPPVRIYSTTEPRFLVTRAVGFSLAFWNSFNLFSPWGFGEAIRESYSWISGASSPPRALPLPDILLPLCTFIVARFCAFVNSFCELFLKRKPLERSFLCIRYENL